MIIAAWNCNMAFRKKAGAILAHRPDILVVPECECPERLLFDEQLPKPQDILWFGSNKHKGLAVLSYSHYRFKVDDSHNEDFKMIVPISVTGGEFDFNLFAIWANNPLDKDGRYIEQVWKAIQYYDDVLQAAPVILMGDFNSNTIWDRKRRPGNHSTVVKFLADRGIVSAYHRHHQQIQGSEQHPTYYLYRHADKPYHLDYCFLSASLAEKIKTVEIGEHAFWTKYSDHVPVLVEINDKY